MIIDCFIFFNELNMLKFRLEEMNDYVDYFVIVESELTHTGNKKELFFKKNKKMFDKFKNKIIYVVSELPTDIKWNGIDCIIDILGNPKWPNKGEIESYIRSGTIESWVREFLQRKDIMIGLNKLNLSEEDVIMISDVDEIIDTDFLQNIKNGDIGTGLVNTKNGGHTVWQNLYYYNLECTYIHKWNRFVICNYGKLKEIGDCNAIRFVELPIKGNYGWHFSYFGDIDYIIYKIKSFSHQEYNKNEILNKESIEDKIKNKIDLFSRDSGIQGKMWNYEKFNENGYWPKKIKLLKNLFNI